MEPYTGISIFRAEFRISTRTNFSVWNLFGSMENPVARTNFDSGILEFPREKTFPCENFDFFNGRGNSQSIRERE